jgi:hypothetical protein
MYKKTFHIVWLLYLILLSNYANAVEPFSIPYRSEEGKWLYNAQTIVSRNDPLYTTPSVEPWEAMPVGGGDLSAMVRCDGNLRLHLSKSDAWGFWSAFGLPKDKEDLRAPWSYWFFNVVSPGHIFLDFGPDGKAAANRFFRQRLDLYHGKIIIQMGSEENGVEIEVWGHPERKILVIEISDPQSMLDGPKIELSQWRKHMKVGHTSDEIYATEVLARGAIPFLVNTGMQDYFDEKDDPLLNRGTAVSLASPSAKSVECTSDNSETKPDPAIARIWNTKGALGELPLRKASMKILKTGEKKYHIIIAAAVKPKGDALANANKELDDAAKVPLEILKAEHEQWWKDWWSKSFLRIESADKSADWLCAAYHVHLYTLGSVNRGAIPAKWDGGAGLMRGDERRWGGAEHVQETRFTYMPLYGANQLEMAKGYTDFYNGMLPYFEVQTDKMWGVSGLWFPETLFPWGHTMDFQLKETDADYGVPGHFVRWHPEWAPYGKFNWFNPYTGLHFNPGLEISHNYLTYYQYSGDEAFLKDEAYPVIKGVCEFLSNVLHKEWDGLYHLDPASALETWWMARDPSDAMDGIRAIFPEFTKLSEKYNCDSDLRAKCKEILSALPEPPRGLWMSGKVFDLSVDVYAPAGRVGRYTERRNGETPQLYRIYPFGLSGIGSEDYELAKRTFEKRIVNNLPAGWSQDGIWAARLGLAEEASRIVKEQAKLKNSFRYGGWKSGDDVSWPEDDKIPANKRLSTNPFLDAGGNSAFNIQEMLLQSHNGIIRILPAWPEDWSGIFRLRSEGGFLISAGFEKAKVPFVEIQSLLGKECVIENPWQGNKAIVRKGSEILLESEKRELRFNTDKETTYIIEPADKALVPYQSVDIDDKPNNSPGLPGRD